MEQYLSNEDIMKVAHHASSTFTRTLSKDEIKSCILRALWRAAGKYDKSKLTKLTTYLYNGVIFECLNQKRANKPRCTSIMYIDKPCPSRQIERLDMLDAIYAKCDCPELVVDRFYGGMTIQELAEKHSTSNETIRLRLLKNIEKLKPVL
jgi:DNA-directed RNA polymerase specialized sigma24 family protein